jgi:hypothetical protein
LSGAAVPFNFDVHALIFSEDANALEKALHQAFNHKKLNWVNPRKEFFNVTLDEIKQVVHANYDKIAEFTDYAEAEQYRTSLILREEYLANSQSTPQPTPQPVPKPTQQRIPQPTQSTPPKTKRPPPKH